MHQAKMARDVSKIVFRAAHRHNWFWTDGWFELFMELNWPTFTNNVNNEEPDLIQLTRSFQNSREMTECFSSLRKVDGDIQKQRILEDLVRVFVIPRNEARTIIWITKRYSKIFPEFSLMMKCTDQGTLYSKEAIRLVSGNQWYQRKDDFRRIYKNMKDEEKLYSDTSLEISNKADALYFQFFAAFCFLVGLFFLIIIRQRHKNSQKILKSANELLNENKLSLQQAQSIAHIGSWEWNLADGDFIPSDEMYRIYGIDSTERFAGIQDLIEQIIHPEDKEFVLAQAEEISRKGKCEKHTYRIVPRDGEIHWIEAMAPESKETAKDGTPISLIGTVQDITERKQAEKKRSQLEEQLRQAQKMESIGTLAGGIAHDFNNILGIIIGNTELSINDVPERDPVRYNLEEIHKASLRARDMVRQILRFSRQDNQEVRPIQIRPIIEDALKLIRSSIPTTIEIRQKFSAHTEAILADPTQINQILLNLCTNATHAMRESGGVLEVALKDIDLDKKAVTRYHELTPGKYIVLTVRDTGYGMEPDVVDRIFDPYFTTKEVGEGTGMGLAVIHGIVKKHNGAIQVYSEPGKGTTFKVLFPVAESKPVPEATSLEALPTGTEKILFVDDEAALADLGGRMLQHLGYEVTVRTGSHEALGVFKAQPDNFDLLMTDMTMPNMTGKDLAQEILQIRPGFPVILCTGFSEIITEEKAKQIGIKAFVMKPLAVGEVATTIRQVLDQGEIKKESTRGTILLVEDDNQFRGTIRQMLERAGHEVIEAPDGKVAAKLYREKASDLIITDLLMPEKEGIELIQDLKHDFPDVKIIAISGGGRLGPDSYLPIAKGLGALYTFEKPFKQEDLLAAVKQILHL